MRAAALASTLLVALSVVVARAEVVSRTMTENAEFAEPFGPGERVKTPSDARLQLYAETAEECRRLEKMSALACRVESLTLHANAQAGRTTLLGSVRFALGPPGDKAAAAPDDAVPSQNKPSAQH